jgi:hypothetical protein
MVGSRAASANSGLRYTKHNACVLCSALRTKARNNPELREELEKRKAVRKRGFSFNGERHPKTMAERVAKRRKDRPLPKLREAKVTPLLLPLVELAYDGYRYPYGDRDFRFCGLTRMASSLPYCQPHYDLCNNPSVPRSLSLPSSLAA